MSESSAGIQNELKNSSRRRFFGQAAAVIPTAVIAAHEVMHEKQILKEGKFSVHGATWYPLYEYQHAKHEEVLNPKNIPNNLQVLSLEHPLESNREYSGENIPLTHLTMPVQDILTAERLGADTKSDKDYPLFPEETITYLQENNIPLVLGDIEYTGKNSMGLPVDISQTDSDELRKRIGQILIDVGVGAGVGEKVAEKVIDSETIDRRGFLGKLGAGMVAAGVAAYAPPVLRYELHDKVVEESDDKIKKRIWARINSINSNLLPEHLNDLFRELIQANKLLTLAEHLKNKENNDNPNIGYNWHLGHRGIEDWLRLGPDITREIILAFPKELLTEVIAANADKRALYAMRLVDVPKSFTIEDKFNGFKSGKIDPDEVYKDEIIEDTVLKERLVEMGLV